MKKGAVSFSWIAGWIALVVLFILSVWVLVKDFQSYPDNDAFSVALAIVMDGLLFFCLGLAWVSYQQKQAKGEIVPRVKSWLFWTPRILTLLFTAFIFLFSFDVFEGTESIWMKLGGFLVHSIPAFIMLVGCIFAWRHEWLGAVVFMGWGVYYVMTFGGFALTVYLQLGALPFSMGLLYLLNWLYRGEVRLAR